MQTTVETRGLRERGSGILAIFALSKGVNEEVVALRSTTGTPIPIEALAAGCSPKLSASQRLCDGSLLVFLLRITKYSDELSHADLLSHWGEGGQRPGEGTPSIEGSNRRVTIICKRQWPAHDSRGLGNPEDSSRDIGLVRTLGPKLTQYRT